jgi:hypothetical protein
MEKRYYVRAIWDSEASVWTSQTDIPGLVIEANTLAEFESLIEELAPEMLVANTGVEPRGVSVHFSAERQLALA